MRPPRPGCRRCHGHGARATTSDAPGSGCEYTRTSTHAPWNGPRRCRCAWKSFQMWPASTRVGSFAISTARPATLQVAASNDALFAAKPTPRSASAVSAVTPATRAGRGTVVRAPAREHQDRDERQDGQQISVEQVLRVAEELGHHGRDGEAGRRKRHDQQGGRRVRGLSPPERAGLAHEGRRGRAHRGRRARARPRRRGSRAASAARGPVVSREPSWCRGIRSPGCSRPGPQRRRARRTRRAQVPAGPR